jgi:hypothetical protein
LHKYTLTFVLLIGLSALPLWAGAQLSINDLVERSTAVAKVTVQWDSKKPNQPGQVTVDNWLQKPSAQALAKLQKDPALHQKWLGLCLPDGHMLNRWITQYSHFDKDNIQVWQNALKTGSVTQIVFFRPSPVDGAFKPTCETESLLARHWSTHPGFAEYEKAVVAALPKPQPPQAPLKPAPKKHAPQKEYSTPQKQKGCSCQSSL